MIDELKALQKIKERFGKTSKNVSLGIGDDAAAVKIRPGKLLLATADSQVEDVHFIKKSISAADLGRKAVAVAVSDIGAMGGIPAFFLASVGFSKGEDERYLEGLMDGFQTGAQEFNMELIGGNLSASEKLFIDITVLGEVEAHLMVKRSGAKPGDAVYVSGTLGDSALGLQILKYGTKSEKDNHLISRHTVPQPRLALGRELAKKRIAAAMIDISDGLILDLERITAQYGLGAEIYADRIPLSSHYRKRIGDFIEDYYKLALSGGEDYELLFISAQNKRENIKEISVRLGINITEIGYITSEQLIKVLDSAGREVKAEGKGFIHFGV